MKNIFFRLLIIFTFISCSPDRDNYISEKYRDEQDGNNNNGEVNNSRLTPPDWINGIWINGDSDDDMPDNLDEILTQTWTFTDDNVILKNYNSTISYKKILTDGEKSPIKPILKQVITNDRYEFEIGTNGHSVSIAKFKKIDDNTILFNNVEKYYRKY